MLQKTNAIRLLDKLQITYSLREYEIDEENLSALHVAETLGIDPESLYKTLVLKGQQDPYLVAVIPANAQLNMKKIAHISGNKNCEMLPLKDLLSVTGYIRGGCSPIGMKKLFPTYIEELSSLLPVISVSSGKRGLQILINPTDLSAVLNGTFADIVS